MMMKNSKERKNLFGYFFRILSPISDSPLGVESGRNDVEGRGDPEDQTGSTCQYSAGYECPILKINDVYIFNIVNVLTSFLSFE